MDDKNFNNIDDIWENSDLSEEERLIEETIREAGRTLQIPDKLSPDGMKNRLEEHIRKKRRRKKQIIGFLSAAAMMVLLVGTGVITYRTGMIGRKIETADSDEKVLESGKDTNAGNSSSTNDGTGEEEQLAFSKSYDEVYEAFRTIYDRRQVREKQTAKGDFFVQFEEATEATNDVAATDSAEVDAVQNSTNSTTGANEQDAAQGDYSKTNIQVENVDEGDIVKTDGSYIYRIAQSTGDVSIVKTDNGMMETVAVLEGFSSPQELYIWKDTLIVLDADYEEYERSSVKKNSGVQPLEDIGDVAYEEQIAPVRRNYIVKIYFYDISDKENPKRSQILTQSGSLSASRVYGEYLYFVTTQMADVSGKESETYRYVPRVNGECIAPDDIYIPEDCDNMSYQTISSVQISNPEDIVDTKAVASSGNTFYMSTESFYIADTIWVDTSKEKKKYTNKTEITKFGVKNGKITSKGSTRIKGIIEDSFSMDEYEGNLRVVTSVTHYKRSNRVKDFVEDFVEDVVGIYTERVTTDNSLYVLDDEMELIGSIEGLAEDERIYSARFMGDMGYFVTYRETDPLFSVDLSNPKKPKIIGELKIPGFSEYLHFYDENLLLGIGEERDETGFVGLKLSMFDISDPTNVVEKDKMVLREYAYADALYNHRAVMIDTNKNLFGFLAECSYDWEALEKKYTKDSRETSVEKMDQGVWIPGHFALFSYDEKKGFIREMTVPLAENEMESRGLYIGDVFYLSNYYDKRMSSYRISTKEHIDSLNSHGVTREEDREYHEREQEEE